MLARNYCKRGLEFDSSPRRFLLLGNMNSIDLNNINEIIAYRERKEPDFIKGGTMTSTELYNLSTPALKELITNYQKDIVVDAKALIDKIFKEYAEPDDNIIIIGAAFVPERTTCEVEDPLDSIDFNDHEYNKLFYPIGSNWDLSNYFTDHKGIDDAKYDAFYNEVFKLYELLYSLGIPTPEEEWESDNHALNEYWYGCIGVMKDYRVVSFVIRDDGMLCDESGFDTFHNHTIKIL